MFQVMLMDIQAKTQGQAVSKGATSANTLYPSEKDWINSAASYGDDILWVAPAGDSGNPVYPAALQAPNRRLLSVGAIDCNGRRWPAGAAVSGQRIDLLAPGVNITGAAPSSGPGATLVITSPVNAASGGRQSLDLGVVSGGDAKGRPEAPVVVVQCRLEGTCPSGSISKGGGAPQLCVLQWSSRDRNAVCTALTDSSCSAGVVLAIAAGEKDPEGWEDTVGQYVDDCFTAAVDGPPQVRPAVLLARKSSGARLLALLGTGGKATGLLSVTPAQQAVRTGTSQAAAWVVGAAAHLMARFPICNATDVATAMLDTAALLSADGSRTGRQGPGGLLQVQAAEDWLGQRPCAKQKLPAAPPAFNSAFG